MVAPFLDFFAKEHPALVHVPLGMAVALPLALFLSIRSRTPSRWVRTSAFLAATGLAGGMLALASGLLWGRLIGLIAPGAWLPPPAAEAQVVQRLLRLHIFAAVSGLALGGLCLARILAAWRAHPEDHPRQAGRRFWEHGVGLPTLLLGLLWLGAWGFCGKLGGIMVFGNEETARIAAEAEARRKNDAEADLPLRALDYASLEPVQAAPVLSGAHGRRWVRTWVPPSAIDAYRAGAPLPPGAYAVLASHEDDHGKPALDPGPLYFKEILADGRPGFAFYWPRVPQARRGEVAGEDFVYWRSPDPRLAACAACHRDAGPARTP